MSTFWMNDAYISSNRLCYCTKQSPSLYEVRNEFGGAFLVAQMIKESAHSVEDPGLIPGSARSPGEGNDYPLWYSCMENFKDTGAWQATVHGISKNWT